MTIVLAPELGKPFVPPFEFFRIFAALLEIPYSNGAGFATMVASLSFFHRLLPNCRMPMLSHPEVRTYWYDRVRDALEFTPPEGFFPRSIAKHLADFTISEGCVEAHAPSGETIRCRVTPATEEEKERFAQKLADTPDLLRYWLEGKLVPRMRTSPKPREFPSSRPFTRKLPTKPRSGR